MDYQQRPVCDSYFVDSHESRARARRDELREHERHIQRETQKSLALDLSDLASEEYGTDIMKHLQTME
ncbi:MAG: hypothetical protein Q9174_004842, partial [Haloplaca sp. 1 TL-2023]